MDVVEAIYGRRSIRSYAQRPVEQDLIEALFWTLPKRRHRLVVWFRGPSMSFWASSASRRSG
jgi:hypothetical protein